MDDKTIWELILAEERRQREGLELIPSENYVSRDVLTAMGSVFTNKYSEGYPGRRYYGGQENTDQVENIAIERAKKLFKADHANVQPHSGAPANEAVYSAWLEPGDTVLAMDLGHGGHLTHGAPVTRSAKLYNFVRYGMKDIETGEIDYDELRALALEHKPKIILAGFSAYPRELDYEKFAEIGREVGDQCLLMADMAHIAGLIVAGVAKNPFDYGFHVITTTTHKTLRGPRGGLILSKGTVGNPLKAPEKTLENIPTLIDRAVFPGMQGGPHMHIIAAKAVAFGEALKPEFKTYAEQILKNAKTLADEMMQRGFKLISNGTDNHLILADVHKSFGLDGKVVEETFDKIGLTLNKNAVANDTLPRFAPSGIRLGTPALTTRGLKEKDMATLAEWMKQAIDHRDDEAKLAAIHNEVKAFAAQFPLPSDKLMADRFTSRLAVFVVIRNDKGEILLQQRAGKYLAGYWDFPSGHGEYNEGLRESAVRELMEEVGLHARPEDLRLMHIEQFFMDHEYVNFTFVCDKWEGKPRICEPDKCSGVEFFAPDNLPEKCVNAVRAVAAVGFSDELTYSITNKENYEALMGEPAPEV